ncbi:MAG TPA: hypothetical protein VGI88_05435 [Verrucomicrobiae bacterium]
MMEPRLQRKLGELESALRRVRLWRRLALCWVAAAAFCVALFLFHEFTGWNSRLVWVLPMVAGVAAAIVVWTNERRRPADFPALVAALERLHPELRHLLSAAAEQQPNPDSGDFHFLQQRVIGEVLTHRQQHLWGASINQKSSAAFGLQIGALVAFAAVLLISHGITRGRPSSMPRFAWMESKVTVSPGDTNVERGIGLVISARFDGRPPAEAALVLVSASGKTKRIPLERHLADPVFGASLSEVTEDGLYHVEYANKKTPDYKITVFDYPALSRADASLQFPAYTGLTNKIIPDTLRVSAVEGTRLTYTLELNKPVARARLIASRGDTSLPLAVQTNAVATLDEMLLTNSARYSLELVDADGRTNKSPAEFSIQVLTNRRPEVKVAFPHGDQRVSPLEELQLQAEATDDFGVLKYGVGFGIAGQDPKMVELGGPARANEKRQFSRLISMEKLGVNVDQLVSYFAWADDYGPDGKVRRTYSDMFFAEVRPFEEIFRPDQSGEAESGQGQGSQATKLAELQKQIVIATWKLERDKSAPQTK